MQVHIVNLLIFLLVGSFKQLSHNEMDFVTFSNLCVQAYYGSGVAPPFFASTVPSTTPHPYVWGGQVIIFINM